MDRSEKARRIPCQRDIRGGRGRAGEVDERESARRGDDRAIGGCMNLFRVPGDVPRAHRRAILETEHLKLVRPKREHPGAFDLEVADRRACASFQVARRPSGAEVDEGDPAERRGRRDSRRRNGDSPIRRPFDRRLRRRGDLPSPVVADHGVAAGGDLTEGESAAARVDERGRACDGELRGCRRGLREIDRPRGPIGQNGDGFPGTGHGRRDHRAAERRRGERDGRRGSRIPQLKRRPGSGEHGGAVAVVNLPDPRFFPRWPRVHDTRRFGVAAEAARRRSDDGALGGDPRRSDRADFDRRGGERRGEAGKIPGGDARVAGGGDQQASRRGERRDAVDGPRGQLRLLHREDRRDGGEDVDRADGAIRPRHEPERPRARGHGGRTETVGAEARHHRGASAEDLRLPPVGDEQVVDGRMDGERAGKRIERADLLRDRRSSDGVHLHGAVAVGRIEMLAENRDRESAPRSRIQPRCDGGARAVEDVDLNDAGARRRVEPAPRGHQVVHLGIELKRRDDSQRTAPLDEVDPAPASGPHSSRRLREGDGRLRNRDRRRGDERCARALPELHAVPGRDPDVREVRGEVVRRRPEPHVGIAAEIARRGDEGRREEESEDHHHTRAHGDHRGILTDTGSRAGHQRSLACGSG